MLLTRLTRTPLAAGVEAAQSPFPSPLVEVEEALPEVKGMYTNPSSLKAQFVEQEGKLPSFPSNAQGGSQVEKQKGVVPYFSLKQKLEIEKEALSILTELGFSPVPPPEHHGGRIQHYLKNWQVLTQDPWILEVVQGRKIEWVGTPVQMKEPKPLVFGETENQLVDLEVQKMLDLKVIEPCVETPGQFVGTMFLRDKPDGGKRPIFNVKPLNQYTEYVHFKIEGIPALIDQIQSEDWQYKIDLSNAYWSVPLHEEDKILMRFRWRGQLYQYRTWPFGLGPVPRWWTKLLKPAVALLRKLGARNVIYMDDLWGSDQDRAVSALHACLTGMLLGFLGFVKNSKKSIEVPLQIMDDYLGYIVNSIDMSLSLPERKILKIQRACQNLLDMEVVTVRDLAKVTGQLVATSKAVLPAPLHYRTVQMEQISALLKGQRRYGAVVVLGEECKKELRWWIHNLREWNGKSFIAASSPASMIVTSDASGEGWGSECQGVTTQGRWMSSEAGMHINHKELLAASMSIKAFTKDRAVSHVHLRSDNMTTVSQIARMGGTRSRSLFNITADLWKYCIDRGIMLTSSHLRGIWNVTADQESRVFRDSSSWKLLSTVYQAITRVMGVPEVDLFADRTNFQHPIYMSWKPDPQAIHTDAFTVKWHGRGLLYLFPPFCMIGKCLAKIQAEQVTAIMITPTWQAQTFYPRLLQMSVEDPILLPQMDNLLLGPRGEEHPLIGMGSLTLAAWKVSGEMSAVKAYQQQLKGCFRQSWLQERSRLMQAPGMTGVAGVTSGVWIRFQPLWRL